MTTVAGFCADMADPGTLDIAAVMAPAIPAADRALPRGVLIYAGGGTPHIWTRAQADAQAAARYRVPVWVARPGGLTAADGTADGRAAAAAARALGMPTGKQYLIMLDMETWVSWAYTLAFRNAVNAEGYWYTPYGSWSSVRQNYVGSAGFAAADWTDAIHLDPDCWYTQYADAAQAGLPCDVAVVGSWAHVWDTQPPAPAPAPPPPGPSPAVAAVQKAAAQLQAEAGQLVTLAGNL